MTTQQRSDTAPRRTAPAPARQVLVIGPGEGHPIGGPGDVSLQATGEAITVKATGVQTGGALGLVELTTLPGSGPPRHIHHDADEWFYVLSGEYQFLIDDQTLQAGPGTFVFIPRGAVHATRASGADKARALAGFVPGGHERAFEEFAQAAATEGHDGVLPPERAQAIARKYNWELVGPPL